jgi:hypothetical protein
VRRQLKGDARSLALRNANGFESWFNWKEGVPVEATFGELFDAPELWACGCREPLAQVFTMGASTWNTANALTCLAIGPFLSGICDFPR